MITELVDEALIAHNFCKVLETNTTRFYIREIDSAVRFAILHKLDELLTPAELNSAVSQIVPDSFLSNPSFKKNCDLVCIHHLSRLSDFKGSEEQIFAIEEDPYFFKKYVLYYSDAEESAVQDQDFEKLKATVADKELFNKYKEQPLTATQYSVAAKIFIKLPFLELPFQKRDLVPMRLQAEGAVSEAGLSKVYGSIQRLSKTNIDELIKEMISDELANIQN